MIHRLNVRAEIQESRLYLARHLAEADAGEEGTFDISDIGTGLRILCEGKGMEVVIPYNEIIKSMLEVV